MIENLGENGSMDNHGWRTHLLQRLESLFPRGENPLYGVPHAIAVERRVLERFPAINRAAPPIEDIDLVVLRCAAILHDVGFARQSPNWCPDSIEHVKHGLALAESLLRDTPGISASPVISRVLNLIEHHDDSTFAFPTAEREGLVVRLGDWHRHSLQTVLLNCLKEADALTHISPQCVRVAVSEWAQQNLPWSPSPRFGGSVCEWGCSILSNARLLAKRASKDAVSLAGQREVRIFYQQLEDEISAICMRQGIVYEPELCLPHWQQDAMTRLAGQSHEIQILRCGGWEELTSLLRSVPITYDQGVLPYRSAAIESRILPIDSVSPLALYALRGGIDKILEFHDIFMAAYCISIFDLLGYIDYRSNQEGEGRIAPPVVESFPELLDNSQSDPKFGLVDGMHRFSGAHQLGLDRVRCILIRGVVLPLVPLPVTWGEVEVFPTDEPPKVKRRYRYTSLRDFPNGQFGITAPVTEDNYQYFLYRDLSVLGSAGVRNFPKR